MPAVYRLAYDVYLAAGFCGSNPERMLRHYPHLDGIPETTVLLAKTDGQLVGSNTVTVDGPAGLPMDVGFREVVDEIRGQTGVVASSWRLVTDPSCRQGFRAALKLTRKAFEVVRQQGTNVGLIVVHPRHESYYERFGFRTIARGRCEEVGGQPGLLMRVDFT